MKLDRFVADRRTGWDELDGLTRLARRKPERLGPDGVRRLGALYRSAAADLALARGSFPGDPLVARLEALVGRARHLVYDAPDRRGSVIRFLARDYWRLVAEKPYALLAAFVLLFGPALLGALWARQDPGAAATLVPEQFRPATEPGHPWRALSPGEQAAFTSEVFTNNIKVTLVAFAGGITFGLLTGLALIYNGVLLGVIGGLMTGSGNAVGFVDLVTAHGVLELSCILVAGAAGLRLGWALVDPGRLTRSASAVREARKAVQIALGTAPWLILAGVIEGNRARLAESGVGVVIAVGLLAGGLYWGLVIWRGRVRSGQPTWPADTP
ncbi:MAG: hypothetical protein QOG81_174 [Gaiellaceae bacterium]|nr:hypothetical protein [Gaiellaceae bacterium]